LIRLENTDYEAFIYENGNHYFGSDREDRNYRVGITGYITPTKDMENRTIVYKSGRTTGLTYGIIKKIDHTWYLANGGQIYPTILITKCPNGQCYYSGNISAGGDSGGVWYIRYVIYSQRIDGFRVYDYGARVIGIQNAAECIIGNPTICINAIASWAVKVREKWSDISFATCGPDYSPSCR
jgi:hypothetical protein